MLPSHNAGKGRHMYTYMYIYSHAYSHTLFACVFQIVKRWTKKILKNLKNWLPMEKEPKGRGIKARFSEYTLFYSLTLELC